MSNIVFVDDTDITEIPALFTHPDGRQESFTIPFRLIKKRRSATIVAGMKKIFFILSALTVCFMALPKIKKAIRQIARNESIRVFSEIQRS